MTEENRKLLERINSFAESTLGEIDPQKTQVSVQLDKLKPIMEEIAAENPQYLIGKINVEKEPELAQKFHVLSIPTLAVIKNGNVVSQSAGARPKTDILAMLKG